MIIISGKVIRGEGFGKTLGFPTANLDRREYIRKKIKMKFGVYAGLATISQKKYKAGIVIGPLDKNRLPKIEAHIIGLSKNLYGKKITVILKKFLRPFKKYPDIHQLKKQIKSDIEKIKKIA